MTAFRQAREQSSDRTALAARARAAMDPASPTRITYEEFLEWADEDSLVEWVDGKVTMTSPPSAQHQRIGSFLANLLSLYAGMYALGEVFSAPFQMKLPTSGREPDVLFVTAGHRERIRPTFLDGPADLVVEIISLESSMRDRVEKRDEYEQGGVREYWLIDPLTRTAIFYQRILDGSYSVVPPDARGRYTSLSGPNFWLEVDWLWREPLPDLVSTLLAITGNAFRDYVNARVDQPRP